MTKILTIKKAVLAYYGGKQHLLSQILPLIPPHSIYTEAFFGGGEVFFAKEPAKIEAINDRNKPLMELSIQKQIIEEQSIFILTQMSMMKSAKHGLFSY